MSAIILRGDARELPLPDESVDLIVTSPPYFGLRDYRDAGESLAGQIGSEDTPQQYVATLLECTREWMRVLKPSGSLFVNLGDKYSQRVAARPSSHQDGLFPNRPELAKDWKRDRAAGLARMPYENVIDDAGNYVREKSLIGLPWRYALGCIDDLGLVLRAEIIWAKTSGLPESVRDRVRRSHEQVFHFTREACYYAGVDEIREPHAEVSLKRAMPHRSPPGRRDSELYSDMPGQTLRLDQMNNPLGKLPGSVWEINSQPFVAPDEMGLDHFAAFPMELPRRAILGWSPTGICEACGAARQPVHDGSEKYLHRPGGADHIGVRMAAVGSPDERTRRRVGDVHTVHRIVGYACACNVTAPQIEMARKLGYPDIPPTRPAVVLDPFGGTGTTALVAGVLGRTGVSVDRSADYCRLARWRTTDAGERARAMQVPKPPPVPDGQGSLFDAGEATA